jgi:hypothetical protein
MIESLDPISELLIKKGLDAKTACQIAFEEFNDEKIQNRLSALKNRYPKLSDFNIACIYLYIYYKKIKLAFESQSISLDRENNDQIFDKVRSRVDELLT